MKIPWWSSLKARWITILMVLMASPLMAYAQETTEATAKGLAPLDWFIIVIYAISTIGLGWYYGKKQTTTKEYFAGTGDMPWFLIGVSLFATLLSTITYLSIPGEMLGKGPIYLSSLLALPLVYPVVAYWLLPLYMKNKVTSAYELLEIRLGLSVRLLGAVMFLLLRLVWMSLLVYLAAKAMSVMMGVDEKYIPVIVLVTGSVSVIYTSLGGLRAVVLTDFIQSVLLLGGALLVIAMITFDLGGFSWLPTQFQDHWDTQPIVTLDPTVRMSIFGTVLSVFCWYVFTSGGDQVSVQRFMSTRDIKAARRALMTQLIVVAFITITLGLVGFALMGYFQAHPELLPTDFSFDSNADAVYPRYIAFHLPIGISGVVVAAMFAAAMSSIDSGVNSITAVVMSDFLERFGYHPKTEKGSMFAARCLALAIGAIIVIGSSFVGAIEGNITVVTGKTANLLVTPIFCLFFFALFRPKAKTITVWIAWAFGFTTAILVGFSPEILHAMGHEDATGISFQWIAPASFIVNIGIGLLIHYILGQKTEEVVSEA